MQTDFPIGGVEGQIAELNSHIESIPEITNNANGTALKFPSGIMICKKTVSTSVSATTAWGSVYETEVVSFGDWAVAFNEVPTVFANTTRVDGELACTVEIIGSVSKTSAGGSRLFRPTSASGTIKINVLGIGTWK